MKSITVSGTGFSLPSLGIVAVCLGRTIQSKWRQRITKYNGEKGRGGR
jgi:hypothetical protein